MEHEFENNAHIHLSYGIINRIVWILHLQVLHLVESRYVFRAFFATTFSIQYLTSYLVLSLPNKVEMQKDR